MTTEQAEEMKAISEGIIECWTRIKAKARANGQITNIEKYAPCLTGALNTMENFLPSLKETQEG
jgi:hypothetical protein